MEVKLIENAQQRLFDFDKLFLDNYVFQIEATTCLDEKDNRVNIIFPQGVAHYQVTFESWKERILHDISEFRKQHDNQAWFFEVKSIKEYCKYLEYESYGLSENIYDHPDWYFIYVLLFQNCTIEVISYEKPLFVYSYTWQHNKD